MTKKKKILRIRPFNMANFSSGAGFLAFSSLIGVIFIIPAAFFIWCGLASSIIVAKGETYYDLAKQRANRILLPIAIVSFFIIASFGLEGMLSYFRNPTLGNRIVAIWIAAFPTLGFYCVVRLIIAWFGNGLSTTKLLLGTLAGSILLGIFGVISSFVAAESAAASLVVVGFFTGIGLFLWWIYRSLE